MMDLSSWMFILVMSSGCGIACMIIAYKKGYKGSQILGWLAAGLFFSVFGMIAVILTPHGHEGAHAAVAPDTCRVCGVPVPPQASQCTHCGSKIAREPGPA
jgi:hypothetical protein